MFHPSSLPSSERHLICVSGCSSRAWSNCGIYGASEASCTCSSTQVLLWRQHRRFISHQLFWLFSLSHSRYIQPLLYLARQRYGISFAPNCQVTQKQNSLPLGLAVPVLGVPWERGGGEDWLEAGRQRDRCSAD